MVNDACLKRRLLFASVEAYHPRPPLYAPSPGWLGARREEIGAGIDLALVGRFAEGIVIAFRGTLPPGDLKPNLKSLAVPSILDPLVVFDWLNNLHGELISGTRVGNGTTLAATIPGRAHEGFAGSLVSLWPGVASAIERLREGDDAPRVYFTGHSKGGALANLAAACAGQVWRRAVVKAVTIGAPRTGDGDFAKAYRDSGIDCIRYEVEEDLVPKIPGTSNALLPSFAGYEPVGTFCPVALKRYPLPFFRLPFGMGDDRGFLDKRIAAHLPYAGFGYGDNVCEPGCQHNWH
jgi:hypothetical protein